MWLKWLDTGKADCVTVFACDFSNSVNQFILFNKLGEMPSNPYIVNWIKNFLFSRQKRVTASGNMTPFFPINMGIPQGTILGPIRFSVQAVDFDRSTLVTFADDLTLSVLVKGIQDQTPKEVENILSWAQNNLMTINLTKNNEMVVKGKVERPLPTVTFDIKQQVFLKLFLPSVVPHPSMAASKEDKLPLSFSGFKSQEFVHESSCDGVSGTDNDEQSLNNSASVFYLWLIEAFS